MNIDNTTLVSILGTTIVVVLIVSYAISWTMTDSGRLEFKKLAVRKQFDLELAKVGAVEMLKLEEARGLMIEAMKRASGTERANYEAAVNALLSDRS